jgi:type VI secretion system protein ImpA
LELGRLLEAGSDVSSPQPSPDAAASTPPPATDTCGPDLDEAGDSEYLNFFAQVEGVLPSSYFSAEDGKPFDPFSVDIGAQLLVADGLLTRSRDIRLQTVRARLLALKRDLAGVAASVGAIAEWLDQAWESVHPIVKDGSANARSTAISSLNLPTVVFALQYAPLFEARRLGAVTYRAWMIANGEAKPRPGDNEIQAAVITEAINAADPAAMEKARKDVALLKTSIDRIQQAFRAHGDSVNLNDLAGLAGKMLALIDPTALVLTNDQVSGDGAELQDHAPETLAALADAAPKSTSDAARALAAIAAYYSQSEPSSPILPLVRQAHQLIGKSFLEVITILMPAHVDKAAFQIGSDQVFELPVGKLSGLSDPAPAGGADTAGQSAPSQPRYQLQSRAQALALLDIVQRYFRHAEPSSPIPMICERARALAQRDFMGVLRDVLPKSALKALDPDK